MAWPARASSLGSTAPRSTKKIAFFRGAALDPEPPVGSKDPNTRYLHVFEGEQIDEAQFTAWVTQAAAMPGWVPGT